MFGRILRGLHYYGGSAMILMVGLHMAQVFLFGSFKYPREMNWMTGVLLLGFTLVMGFTGQLLRWDQTAVWSVVVAAEQAGRVPLIGDWLARLVLGGETLGGSTLSRIFAVHAFLIPGGIMAFVGLHLALVLRHGISEPPKAGHPVDPGTYRGEYEDLVRKTGVPFWPNAAWRDIVFAALMVLGIFLCAVVFGPPELDAPPDPSILHANPRPDFYLLWYFAVLALIPQGIEKYVMVYGPLLAGLLLISVPFLSNKGERSIRRRPLAAVALILVFIMVVTLSLAGARSDWSPNFDVQPLPPQVVGAASGPQFEGAKLFDGKACLNCHRVGEYGGRRGPNLTLIGDKLSRAQLILRISNGGRNMPAYAGYLSPKEMDELVTFLESRKLRSAIHE
jgi:ubiquinol-cytochrome c reductase cytochrome b subunit